MTTEADQVRAAVEAAITHLEHRAHTFPTWRVKDADLRAVFADALDSGAPEAAPPEPERPPVRLRVAAALPRVPGLDDDRPETVSLRTAIYSAVLAALDSEPPSQYEADDTRITTHLTEHGIEAGGSDG